MTQRLPNPSPSRDCRPEPQPRLVAAMAKAWQALGNQTVEQIGWLGGRARGDCWQLAVLGQDLVVDPRAARIKLTVGQDVRPEWQVLVLHYLAITGRPVPQPPEVTFADLPNGRGYAGVYDKRVLKRLCATVGSAEAALRRAAEDLGGEEVPGGDAAYQFTVFPRRSSSITARSLSATRWMHGRMSAGSSSSSFVRESRLIIATWRASTASSGTNV